VLSYGYVYHLATADTANVAGGADIPFSNNGPLSGVSHTAGTTTVTVASAGVYLIHYSVTTLINVGSAVAIAVNGAVQASTNIAVFATIGQLAGCAMLQLSAGNVVTLRNNSALAITLSLSPNVSAQLDLVRLS
jgi:hypothetical protein